jgi:Domain of unknown function (DUF6456)
MFHDHQTATVKFPKLPENPTFLWRNDRWFVQGAADAVCKPLSVRNSRLVGQLKRAGRLEEKAPGLFRIAGDVVQPLVDPAESPLYRLWLTKHADGTPVLDLDQFRAGERLRVDYEGAHLSGPLTMAYEERVGGGSARFSDNYLEGLNDAALTARQKLHHALDAVGPELAGILLHVCCMAGGLEQAELRLSLPRRAGKAVLQLALTRLARHYGFKTPLRHDGPGRIGHWAVEGFRPGLG